MICDVGIIEMDPESQALRQPFPLLHVSPDALLAFMDEGFDSESLDFLLGMNPQFFADFNFDRQAVCVPSAFTLASVASHRLVTRK